MAGRSTELVGPDVRSRLPSTSSARRPGEHMTTRLITRPSPVTRRGPVLWHLGALLTFKATSEQTAGRMWAMELLAPRGMATPVHRHSREDEAFYVLDGEVSVYVGDQVVRAEAGSFLWAPREVPHAFCVESAQARPLVVSTPAGFERFFFDTGEPAARADTATTRGRAARPRRAGGRAGHTRRRRGRSPARPDGGVRRWTKRATWSSPPVPPPPSRCSTCSPTHRGGVSGHPRDDHRVPLAAPDELHGRGPAGPRLPAHRRADGDGRRTEIRWSGVFTAPHTLQHSGPAIPYHVLRKVLRDELHSCNETGPTAHCISMTDRKPHRAPLRRRLVWIIVATGVALAVVGALVFEPWKLFVDQHVDEAPPAAAAARAGGPSTDQVVLARGQLIGHEHHSSGSVIVYRLADGSRVLRIEDLHTSNGPALHVWLSDAPVVEGSAGWGSSTTGATSTSASSRAISVARTT